MITKELARQLQRDYVPNGRAVNIEDFQGRWRRTRDGEILQCGRSRSYDLQSGPIYCGRVAEYVAEMGDDQLILCKRCGASLGVDKEVKEKEAPSSLGQPDA